MAADVDICNLALSYLGDEALVASINPPDGTAQAGHCARFYPIARDQVLEMHTWGFATVRVALAYYAATPPSTWLYAYAAPTEVLNYLEILDPLAVDDYSYNVPLEASLQGSVQSVNALGRSLYTPQPFVVETDANGNDVIYTNQKDAVLRYTKVVTDTTVFSPLAIEAIARRMAAMLAGPLLKGDSGRAEAKAQLGLFQVAMEKAVESDSNQRRLKVAHSVPWMVNR